MIVRVRKSEKLLAKAGVLGEVAGYSQAEAMGRLVNLWAQCLEEKTETLADKYVRVHLGPRGVEALIEAELGERSGDGVRVLGAREEIEQNDRRSEAARAAGKASGRARSGDGEVPEPNERRTSRQPDVNATSTNREQKPNQIGTASLFSESVISESSDSGASSSSELPEDRQQGRRRAGPMPRDFSPTEQHRTFAAEHRLDLALEVERCRDHFAGKGQPQRDWNATFRNWLRNEVRWRGDRGGPPKRTGAAGAAEAMAILDRMEGRS